MKLKQNLIQFSSF